MEQVNPVLVVFGIALVVAMIYFGTRNKGGNAPQLPSLPMPKAPPDQIGEQSQGTGNSSADQK